MPIQERVTRIDPEERRVLPFHVYFADGFPGTARDALGKYEDIRISGADKTSHADLERILRTTREDAIHALIIRSATRLKGDSASLLAKAKSLGLVIRAGIGDDNIDKKIATEHGKAVENTPEGNARAVDVMTLADIEALFSPQFEGTALLREGRWRKAGWSENPDIYRGKTFGIIGLGNIGYQVARDIKKKGGIVIGYDPGVKRDDIEQVSLEDLCSRSDVISLHPALNDSSKNMLGHKQFELMKPGITIVQNSRGGIVNEEALLQGLRDGRVRAAKLDVFSVEGEPLVNDEALEKSGLDSNVKQHVRNVLRPLIDHPRVISTPHSAASSRQAQEKNGVDVANQVLTFATGRGLINGLNFPSVALSRNGLTHMGESPSHRLLVLNKNELKVYSRVEAAIRGVHDGYNFERGHSDVSPDGHLASRVEEFTLRKGPTEDTLVETVSLEVSQGILRAIREVPGILGVHLFRVDRHTA